MKSTYIIDVRLAKGSKEEMERLHKQLKQEQLLKAQAVNKLAEILNRKDINSTTKNKKVSSADLKRKEKECRKLQQELTQVIHFIFLLAFTLLRYLSNERNFCILLVYFKTFSDSH